MSACQVARWRGLTLSPDAMITAGGLPVGAHSYTFAQIIKASAAIGLKLVYRSGATWEVIKAELAQNRPVITLLRYGNISGNQDTFIGSHFWVCVGYDDENVYVNDPNWWQPRRAEGAHRVIPLAEFTAAIGDALTATGNAAHQALFVE